MSAALIALNRFGLGARPGESRPSDPQQWLLGQFKQFDVLPVRWRECRRTKDQLQLYLESQVASKTGAPEQKLAARQDFYRRIRDDHAKGVAARVDAAVHGGAPFVERLVHFWANHFAVSIETVPVLDQAAAFEADAIRPHVLGRFEDLLLAAVHHPAMLYYLDQSSSLGPNSTTGIRLAESQAGRRRGLNENLAREILELHTLGVRSGYTQSDVLELARALTGWTALASPTQSAWSERYPGFVYRPEIHEPGERTLLAKKYGAGQEEQSAAMLHDIAVSRATATHIATKLARHFVADDPPAKLVTRLADAFVRTGGDLPSVYAELVTAPESWEPAPAKFKTPWEWAISSMRALELPPAEGPKLVALMYELGQPVWRPGSPAGFDDVSATWASSNALVMRAQIAERLVAQAGAIGDARELAPRILPALSRTSARVLAQADTPEAALVLMLVAPEFLRR